MSARPSHPQDPNRQSRNARLAEGIATNEMHRLRLVALRRGVPEDEVADVVQSALTDFLRAFPGPDDPSKALSYAFRCVHNRALKYARWRARRQAPLRDVASLNPDGPADAMDAMANDGPDTLERVLEREDYRQELARLSELAPELRQVIALRGLGYAPGEIAELTGASLRSARKRIERANRKLSGAG
jgi:RNA polymerase sigma factor (sigma-70 family)